MACILLEYRHFSVHPIHEFESIVISISHARQETIAVLAGQLLVSASNFMTGILLARSLGPEGYGQYALAMGTMLFLGSIQTALIISPMMVKGPGRAEGAEGYYRFLHRSQLLFAVAACSLTLIAGALVSVAFSEWNIAPLVLPLAAVAFCAGTQEFARRLFLVQRRAVAALGNDLTTHGLRLGMLWLLLVTGSMNVGAALWVIAGASAFGTIAAAMAVRRGACRGLDVSAGQIVQEHWTFGKWLLASNIAYWCGSQMTIYVAASLLSVGVVGGMSAALSLTGTANVLVPWHGKPHSPARGQLLPRRRSPSVAPLSHQNFFGRWTMHPVADDRRRDLERSVDGTVFRSELPGVRLADLVVGLVSLHRIFPSALHHGSSRAE